MKMIKAGFMAAALLATSACGNQDVLTVSKLAGAGSFDASKLPSAARLRLKLGPLIPGKPMPGISSDSVAVSSGRLRRRLVHALPWQPEDGTLPN